jgi:hypothetical protein
MTDLSHARGSESGARALYQVGCIRIRNGLHGPAPLGFPAVKSNRKADLPAR